jgi:hypothetical protein
VNDWRKALCIVETLSLAATLSDKTDIVPRDGLIGVRLSFVYPHNVHDAASNM